MTTPEAVDVPTGAMVALVPSDADAQRIALADGEAVAELHLTLCYLGDAVDIDDDVWAELTDAMRALAGQWQSVEAEAFAPALFNPTGPEPCAVLICSGADLAEFYETVLADVTEVMPLPDDAHAPWCAHVTVLYSEVYAARDRGTGDAGTFSSDRRSGGAIGVVPDYDLDSVQASALLLDPPGAAGQYDTNRGSVDGESTSDATRRRASLLRDSEMRGADTSPHRERVDPLEASRPAADARSMLEASRNLQSTQRAGLGGMRDVSARRGQPLPPAPLRESARLSRKPGGSGGATASGGQVQPEAGSENAERREAARTPRALEAIADLIDRVGPMTFDRIRLARACDVTDIPLAGFGAVASPELGTPGAEGVPGAEAPPITPAETTSTVVVATGREIWDGPLGDWSA